MLFRDYPFLKDYVPKPVVTFKNKKMCLIRIPLRLYIMHTLSGRFKLLSKLAF
jgi:hypothetical protein